MRKSSILILLGVVLIVGGYLLPLDVALVKTYRGYDIYYDIHETRMYLISGLSGTYSSVAAAEAAIDDLLGPPPAENTAPHAECDGPYTGIVDEEIYFYSVGSYDPEGDPLAYTWNFGDGAKSIESSPRHRYGETGTYTVTLIVVDPDGATGKDTSTVKIIEQGDPTPVIENKPPNADVGGPYAGVVDETIDFNGAGSSDRDGSIVGYTWYYGDGETGRGGTTVHSYSEAGEYTVELIVTDNEGAVNSDQTTCTIVEPAREAETPKPEPEITGYRWASQGFGASLVFLGLILRRHEG